ncbi:MAG: hypothetical protein PHS44_03225 [Candidatus Dojkabacteria bacterium]|nr:hypothetical protein [Candidatus Dojkabacteria bacterium]
MSRKLELEIRGELTKQQYDDLLEYLHAHGMFLKEFTRFQMLFFQERSEDLESHKHLLNDLRIRVENGNCSITLKHGHWQTPSGREEYIIPFEKKYLNDIAKMLYHLGNRYGKIMLQETQVFRLKGVEWAVVKVPHKDLKYVKYYWEAEKETLKKDEEKNLELLNQSAKALNLSIFSKDEFIRFLELLNKIPGRSFNFKSKSNIDMILNKFVEYI